MQPIEIDQLVNGELRSTVMPALHSGPLAARPALCPGPDVIVGDLPEVAAIRQRCWNQFVAGVWEQTSCNNGDRDVDWFALPNNDHPVIPQNLYRMSGGTNNNDRFEQIGQSWLKHAFLALENDACGFGCNAVVGHGPILARDVLILTAPA